MKLAWEILHAGRIELSAAGQKVLHADLAIEPCFEQLVERGCYPDARRLLAQALPKPRALWWGLSCARDYYGAAPPPAVAQVLAIVDEHIKTGSEASRRRAEEIGRNGPPDELTQCLALGVFFSGGSVVGEDLPVIAPCPYATGRFIETAVYFAAVLKDAAGYRDHLRRYLDLGYSMLPGRDPWLDAEKRDGPAIAAPAAEALLCTGGRS